MNKPFFKAILRHFGIIKLSDTARFQIMKLKNRKSNLRFVREHPNVPIPPDYILYEAHKLNYESYISNGLKNAKELVLLFEKYTDLSNKKLLDWGCGPARIIRHLSELLPNTSLFGIDYNPKSIAWNKANFSKIFFDVNAINPPTSFEDGFFDAIYGLSIFTHLSEENHFNWISELYRISSPGAILILTTHGQAYREKLLPADKQKFDANKLVTEGNTLEGHRTYAAYHPPKLMRQMFEEKFTILEHIPGKKERWGIIQDKWILKKEL